MTDQQTSSASDYKCDGCDRDIPDNTGYYCNKPGCDDIDFCEQCFGAKRFGEHARHKILRFVKKADQQTPATQLQQSTAQASVPAVAAPQAQRTTTEDNSTADHAAGVPQRQQRTAQTLLKALTAPQVQRTTTEDNATADNTAGPQIPLTADHTAEVKIPLSLVLLDNARHFYNQANAHTSAEEGPFTPQTTAIVYFKTSHYSESIRNAWDKRWREQGVKAVETIQHLNDQVSEETLVKLKHEHVKGVPIDYMARREDRIVWGPILAAKEIEKAVEAMKSEGDVLGLRDLLILGEKLKGMDGGA